MIDLNDVRPLGQGAARHDLDAIIAGLRAKAPSWVREHFPRGRRLGDEWRLANVRGDPPRKNGSCVITLEGDHAGDWIDFDTGDGGGPLSALEHATGLSGRALIEYAAELAGSTPARPAPSAHARDHGTDISREIELILSRCRPIAASPAEAYLAARGLAVPETPDLLFHPDLTHWEKRTGYPALVAIVRDGSGEAVAIHRTYLAPDGAAKADVPKPRMMLGPVSGGAVRLAAVGAGGLVAVAEGIETALAVMTARPGLPVWAALSAGNLEKIALPPEASRVVLLADHDASGTGLAAARRAAERLSAEGCRVWLAVPPHAGDDFNDVLVNEGPDAVRAIVDAAAEWSAASVDAGLEGASTPSGSSGDAVPGGVPLEFTEEALALDFAARHADNLRYCAAWGRWLIWDGTCWRTDETLRAFDLSRWICREASNRALVHIENVKSAARIASALASARTVAAVERLAKADRRHAATAEQWDADEWLLNTPDGIVDLTSGRLSPHRADAYMTRITAAGPGGDCPLWRSFLARVTDGDDDLQAYLQRLAGCALTGSIRDHALFFLYGTGRNGKGVFLNTLSRILNDYAVVASIETFTATSTDRHTTDLAMLRGARLVTAQETEEGRRWAESRIKALTGGDPITARFMRQDNFTFQPQFKLIIAGNHKPGLRNVDEAIRARFNLVPFTVTIPEGERDPRLAARLEAEWAGILAWAVEGCLAWQRIGLAPPKAVLDATAEYMEVEDALGRFLEERCEVGAKDRVGGADNVASIADLFASWQEWCKAAGEHAGTRKRFSQNLEARGFFRWQHPRTRQRGFRGLRLVVHASAIAGGRGDED